MNDDNHSQAQTKVLLPKTSQSPANAQSSQRNMGPSETLVFLEHCANSFAQIGTSCYVAGKQVGVEACKWTGGERKEGKREKKKSTHSNLRFSIALCTPPSMQYHLFFNCSCQSDSANSCSKKCLCI